MRIKHWMLLFVCVFIVACSETNNDSLLEDIAKEKTDNQNQLASALTTVKPKQYSVIDFAGNTVTLTQPAKRIVALAPHLVENVYSAGAGDKLVGVVTHSNFPEQATALPIVGGYEKINHEKIIALAPDLVLTWQSGNMHSAVELLNSLGLTVYVDQADSLEDVAKTINDIGTLAGTKNAAQQATETYLQKIASIKKQYKDKTKVSTLYQVWNSPLQTISGDHIISATIETCGGINIYSDAFAVAPIINIESVIERNPQAIIASGMSEARPEWLDDWKQWPSLKAVQNDNLFFVHPDHIQRHTLRLLKGVEAVCQHLDSARALNNK